MLSGFRFQFQLDAISVFVSSIKPEHRFIGKRASAYEVSECGANHSAAGKERLQRSVPFASISSMDVFRREIMKNDSGCNAENPSNSPVW
jgi:hypothetical protein